jgi:hypothetical protein
LTPAEVFLTFERPLIYFAQPEGGGMIKIGMTEGCVVKRIAALQTQCPVMLNILATKRAAKYHERELHDLLWRHRSHGEWFHPAEEVMAEVAKATPYTGPQAYFGRPRRKSTTPVSQWRIEQASA